MAILMQATPCMTIGKSPAIPNRNRR